MSLRCINQNLHEQFRRVISSDFVIVLAGCSRDWSFSAARESQKSRITSRFCQQSLSKVGVLVGPRYSSSCYVLETRKVCVVGSGSLGNFRAQDFSPGVYKNSSSSRVVGVGLGERRAAQQFSFSPAVSTMHPKKKQVAKESTKNGTTEFKKRTAVWKEQNVRTVSTAAELCKGGNSSAHPNGAPTAASDSTAFAGSSDHLLAVEESMTKEVHVDAMLLRFLVGKGGSTKEKIEKDCKVKLKVPSTHEAKTSKSVCIITGTEARIEAAQKQIKAIVDDAVKGKLQYTHFISLPLAIHPDLLEQVEKFQERILARNQPTTVTSARGDESGASDQEKIGVTDTATAVLNQVEVEGPKAEIKVTKTENEVLEDEMKSPKVEILDKEKAKDVIMDEAEISKAEILDRKKRSFEVKSPDIKTMDTDEGDVEEKAQGPKAETLNIGETELEEESVADVEVMDMEKGIVEVKVIPHKSGIDKSIFVKPRTFHLTVLMLKLWNEDRVQQAAEVLEKTQAAIRKALEGRPVVLDFNGVETMRGKPDKAHVLYARVEDSAEKTRLMQACQVLIDAYVESGLVMEEDIGQALKLHATLMNTTHRTVKKNHRFAKRIPFDATEILEQYGEWKWGEFDIPEAHLSQRFVYGENGYYHCVKSVPFPAEPLSSSRTVASAQE